MPVLNQVYERMQFLEELALKRTASGNHLKTGAHLPSHPKKGISFFSPMGFSVAFARC